ncbi:protein kinase domain protein [Ichthyophthirius multifiliis]|uniref:Protein kinase domain protein n=1 Tax=Ichthyophthirius multifiliis TaxID=5932 RepID=G0QZP8_ICHMU|nr:protein kinase domain protein [Ichthyophthirius multifiliis]EGR29304.1 protein kinase domain protein [Ichthyophthirius multifiliis]|eukprot:XP_004030540.1 protein kinase domain protein [Ichthyophthirius multifiliis]
MFNEFFLILKVKKKFFIKNKKKKSPYSKMPKKIIELKPNNRIVWDYNRSKAPYKLTGFHLLDGVSVYEYFADEITLIKLKEFLGQRIFQARFQDEYEVIAQVGKGNYARVLTYFYFILKNYYEVKCFEKQKLQSLDKGMLSLHNELKIMRDLRNHPNVIKLFDVYEGEHTFYFLMELVEGVSLYEEIKKHSQTPFKDHEIKEIILMLLKGIAYCSQKNIMHRDIKPENLLFGQKGNTNILKIVDFGLAAYQDEDPYIFPKCGTPGFVAPEIANLEDKTKPYSVVCDMFSIGVIFHILLTGEAVFPARFYRNIGQLREFQ